VPKTLRLAQTYIHGGKFYGPGETEVADDAVAADLEARDAAHRERLAQNAAALVERDAEEGAEEAPAPTRRGRRA
jgi:hypothetical protein